MALHNAIYIFQVKYCKMLTVKYCKMLILYNSQTDFDII